MTNRDDQGGRGHSAGVVSIDERRKQRAAHAEARSALLAAVQSAMNALFGPAVGAAMTCPWREWSDEQAVGSVVEISPVALAEVDDPALAAVGRALMDLERAAAALKPPS
jgi:hypothetical protein